MFDSIRGEDSTGVLAVANNIPIVSKMVGDPFELFRYTPYIDSMKRLNKVLLGHNRYATVGGVSKRSAHPFTFGDITGVHNGTLTNKYQLLDGAKFAVDSEALYNHMEQKGLHNLLEHVQGAWCLVWWDNKEETINFLRNKERPLWMTIDKSSSAVFWASEKWMLEVALSRNRVEVEDIVQIPEDQHISFIVDDKRHLHKPFSRKAEGKSFAVTTTYPNQKKTGTITNITEKNTSPSSLRKGVALFGGSVERDGFGAEYLDCVDVTNQQLTIRLYRNGIHNIKTLEGEEFVADIGTMCSSGTEGIYYKIAPFSVKLSAPAEKTYRGNNNKMLTKTDWEAEHPTCCFCDASLKAEGANRLTSQGQCLCPSCATDTEITQYVSMI